MPDTRRAIFTDSRSRRQQPTQYAKAQPYHAPGNPNGWPREIKAIVPGITNSTKNEGPNVVDLLACLQKVKLFLVKAENILKETSTVPKQLKETSQKELSNVAETLQDVSKQLEDCFTKSDFRITEKVFNENPNSPEESGLDTGLGSDLPEPTTFKPDSPSILNSPKQESSQPRPRCAPPFGNKETLQPNDAELCTSRPDIQAPTCTGKNQSQALAASENRNKVARKVTPRPCGDKLLYKRQQNRGPFAQTPASSKHLTTEKHIYNEIYLPTVAERVPILHTETTRAIRKKQDHDMKGLLGL